MKWRRPNSNQNKKRPEQEATRTKMDGFQESFKQAKAPWLSRETFPVFGNIKNLLGELFKNFHDYGNSPYVALGATEHICAQDVSKAKLIRDAKQQMHKTMAASKKELESKKDQDLEVSKEDFSDILSNIAAKAKIEMVKCEARIQNAEVALQNTINERPDSNASSQAKNEWTGRVQEREAAILALRSMAQTQREKYECSEWEPGEIKMAVNKFKKMRQSIASCLEEPESQTDTGTAPVSKSSRSLEDIWVSLVKYLVLQHKSQGASAISFGDALTNEQVELLRSVSQDETNSDLQKSTGETIFSFTTKLQAQEKLYNWIAQSLLPPQEVKVEQTRTDGTLFRVLKKNLPANLAWAAQLVSSDSTRRGSTFQQLVAKIFETADLQEEGVKVVTGDDKKKSSIKNVSFVAMKGRLEKNPNAEVTREERRDKLTTETKTTFRPKKRKQPISEDDDEDDERVVGLVEQEKEPEEEHSLGSLVGLIKGLIQSQANGPARSPFQQATRREWPQDGQRPAQERERGMCYSFQNTGKCSRESCHFKHIDGGNAAARGKREDRAPQFGHNARRGEYQQRESAATQEVCRNFQMGRCSKANECRYSHPEQTHTRQQQAPYQRQADNDRPPRGTCATMWNTSICENSNCREHHGRDDQTAKLCYHIEGRQHCSFLFGNRGCRFSHACQSKNANDVPLGNSLPQKELPSKGGAVSQNE